METSILPQFLCAVSPNQGAELNNFPVQPVWLCYRAGNGPKLYRNAPPSAIKGGLLAVSDTALEQIGSNGYFCRQAVRECQARGASGLFANWSKPPSPQMQGLTAALEEALTQQNLSLWVTEDYGSCCTGAKVLISSALSGGTLRLRLKEAAERFTPERTVLAIERICADFPLPAPDGEGTHLSPQAFQELKEAFHPTVHDSPPLCAHYFTYSKENSVHFVLFDTADSVKKKLCLAKELGLSAVFFAWDEVGEWAKELFPP
jgi:hypothetical protein